jgi:hypothetical protein
MPKERPINMWVTSPIDWWSGMIDLSRHSPRDFAMPFEDALEFEGEVHALLAGAKKLARKNGWEGDISQGPFLCAIPSGDNTTDLVVAWKQSNNGTCFIASRALLVDRNFDHVTPITDA